MRTVNTLLLIAVFALSAAAHVGATMRFDLCDDLRLRQGHGLRRQDYSTRLMGEPMDHTADVF